MKKSLVLLLAIFALLLVSPAAMAISIAPSPCAEGSMASYVSLGSIGCTIGDKLFTDFVVTNPGAWVNVTPVNPDANHMGFQFGGAFLALPGTNFVASLSYNVSVIGGAALIDDMDMHIGGIGRIPPGVFFSVGEDVYNSKVVNVSNLIGALEVGNLETGSLVVNDHAAWKPVNFIHIEKDVTIINPTATGFNFSEITQIVSQVPAEIPEPGTYAMLGAGLAGLAMLRRRSGK